MISGQELDNGSGWNAWPQFACPACHRPLAVLGEAWQCETDNLRFEKEEGIASFILPDRRRMLDEFLEAYCRIRRSEVWGSTEPKYYRDLPYRDLTGKHVRTWGVRARTYDTFLIHLSRQPTRHNSLALDVGAGNCWFAARLAGQGYRVVALDINLDAFDGLGALAKIAHHLRSRICAVRADFTALPFGPGEFDLVVFNASLHYSSDIVRTVSETMNLLGKGGRLYILDSPIYSSTEAGKRMIRERRQDFRDRFNCILPDECSGSFLTVDLLEGLRARYHVETIIPHYGIRWTLRPRLARLFSKREPAEFRIVTIHKN